MGKLFTREQARAFLRDNDLKDIPSIENFLRDGFKEMLQEALEAEMDKELGMMQKMNLRVHLMMCSGCRNFGKQVEFLRQSCRKFMQQDS